MPLDHLEAFEARQREREAATPVGPTCDRTYSRGAAALFCDAAADPDDYLVPEDELCL